MCARAHTYTHTVAFPRLPQRRNDQKCETYFIQNNFYKDHPCSFLFTRPLSPSLLLSLSALSAVFICTRTLIIVKLHIAPLVAFPSSFNLRPAINIHISEVPGFQSTSIAAKMLRKCTRRMTRAGTGKMTRSASQSTMQVGAKVGSL